METICNSHRENDWFLGAAIVAGVLLAGLGWALWKVSVLIPLVALLVIAEQRRRAR